MYYFTLLHSILFLSFNIAYVQHNQSSWLDPTCLILKGLSVAHVPGAISDFAGGHLWVCVCGCMDGTCTSAGWTQSLPRLKEQKTNVWTNELQKEGMKERRNEGTCQHWWMQGFTLTFLLRLKLEHSFTSRMLWPRERHQTGFAQHIGDVLTCNVSKSGFVKVERHDACFVLEIDVFHVFSFRSFLSGMISTNVILQTHANTMLLGRIKFHFASQQFRIPPRQIQILTRSDDQTRWLQGPFPVCFLKLGGPRAQVICCTSNPSLSLSCLQCFSQVALRATFSDFGLSPTQTTKDSGRLHTSMACIVLSMPCWRHQSELTSAFVHHPKECDVGGQPTVLPNFDITKRPNRLWSPSSKTLGKGPSGAPAATLRSLVRGGPDDAYQHVSWRCIANHSNI